jgi:hypothetical protein
LTWAYKKIHDAAVAVMVAAVVAAVAVAAAAIIDVSFVIIFGQNIVVHDIWMSQILYYYCYRI